MKDIEELYEMQKVLDARIMAEKGLEGKSLLPNTVLALQVEICELANEWRGFKHWSNDQEPRTRKIRTTRFDTELGAERGEVYNPLLEEYVDCLHFFLSIAHQKGWPDAIYVHEDAVVDLRDSGFDGGITGAFLEMQYWLLRMHMENKPMEAVEKHLPYSTKEFCFRSAFFIFVALGYVGFGFTWEQIVEAYEAKNKVNHDWQANGY